VVVLLFVENWKYDFRVVTSGIISIPSFMKIHPLVHELNRGQTFGEQT
jgi:hypothetical protein